MAIPFPAHHLTLAAVAALSMLACDVGSRPAAGGAREPGAATSPADDAAVPEPPAVAITIDDLPWLGAVGESETRADALRRMIDAFTARDVPATGFVNCDRIGAGAPLVRMWLDAGLALGNHTASHRDLNDAPLDAWLADVRSCHDVVLEMTGEVRVWFRYPYLHQGPTAERQGAALAVLEELGSPIAHVSIDTSDWILAVAYGEAVQAGDSARAAAIGGAFVAHVLRATSHAQEVARRKLGRDVPHVLLLHANLLVADYIDELLDAFAAEGFAFVSVEAAQRDPAYARADGYTGGDGLSWLYRMEPASPEDRAWDDGEAARLRAEWR